MNTQKLSQLKGFTRRTIVAVSALVIASGSVVYAAATYINADPDTGTLNNCVNTISDTSAVNGKFVRLGDCAGGGGSALDFDQTGNTIPDTNYAIPSGAIFMDDDGNDTNAGTEAAPVKTLNRAVSMAPNPGTIVVRAGLYRDRYTLTSTIITKDLTFQAYPHEQAWFDGTDVIPTTSWTNNGNGTWSMAWNTPAYCDGKYYNLSIDAQDQTTNSGPCYHWDVAGTDPVNPKAGDPQMAFINGTYLHQTKTQAETANTSTNFYYDHANKVIYIGTDPTGKLVEVTARPNAIVFGGSTPTAPGVKGLGFKRYATNEFGYLSGSAVYFGGVSPSDGRHPIAENNVFTKMAAKGLSMRAQQGVARHNLFVNNGFNGMGSNGTSQTAGSVDNMIIQNNLFLGNNAELFGTDCSLSCGSAGVKMAHMAGFRVEGNVFANNKGEANGVWCDMSCYDGVIVNNLVYGNGASGIFYEISGRGIIASNVTVGNKYGIKVVGEAKVYNNTTVNNSYSNIYIQDDNRSVADGVPETDKVYIYNNIVYGGSTYPLVAQGNTHISADDMIDGIDYNAYYRTGGSAASLVTWFQSSTDYYGYKTFPLGSAARTPNPLLNLDGTPREANGLNYYSPTTDPYFVNLAGGDYHVKTSSPAYNSAMALPADVANALGLPTGTVTSRGALWRPGSK